MTTTQISLGIINTRVNKEIALSVAQTWINIKPDFQREYEAWDDKLKTRFVESMLLGRAMNPIWTIFNKKNESEEILDGMHRITTAIDFLNDKFKLKGCHFTCPDYQKYNKKKFSDLDKDDQHNIRNYNFLFNHLDSTYRTDINKRRDMYEILNRSSKPLNDFEFDKVLYCNFFDIINEYKNHFKKMINKNDKRGSIETEILSCLSLSKKLNSSWSSLKTLTNKYLQNNIGRNEEEINKYLENNTDKLRDKLDFFKKIIDYLDHIKFFSDNKKTFNKYYIPYKCIISRLCFLLENISVFNRHRKDIIFDLKTKILDIDIQAKLECNTRNAIFQKKLINLIDDIILSHYDKKDPKNKRTFQKKDVERKLKEQNYLCKKCGNNLKNKKYERDHIIPWSQKGNSEYSNLQILCSHCHKNKTHKKIDEI